MNTAIATRPIPVAKLTEVAKLFKYSIRARRALLSERNPFRRST